MPTYSFMIAVDIPCYGEDTVEAKDLDEAIAKIKERFGEISLEPSWDLQDNPRIVMVENKEDPNDYAEAVHLEDF